MTHVQDDRNPNKTNHSWLYNLREDDQPFNLRITQRSKPNDIDSQTADEDIRVATVLDELVHIEEQNQDEKQTRIANGVLILEDPEQVAVSAAPEGAEKNGDQCEDDDLGTIATNRRHGNHQHSGLRVPPPFRWTQWHLAGTKQHYGTQNEAYNKYNECNKGSVLIQSMLDE